MQIQRATLNGEVMEAMEAIAATRGRPWESMGRDMHLCINKHLCVYMHRHMCTPV